VGESITDVGVVKEGGAVGLPGDGGDLLVWLDRFSCRSSRRSVSKLQAHSHTVVQNNERMIIKTWIAQTAEDGAPPSLT
jgi:hypothetical protein